MKMPFLVMAAWAALSHAAEPPALTVAAAANMQHALERIDSAFQAKTGVPVKPVFGATAKLSMQIKSGAPFDVFVSADMAHADSLRAWGLSADHPRPYAFGKLVVWTLLDLDLTRGLRALAAPAVARIAVADSARAPYGAEAMKALARSGLRDELATRLVFGESIAQVNQYILSGNAQAGVTAKSTVMDPDMRGKGKWAEVDSALYDKIAQGAVVCKHGKEGPGKAASDYLAFLYGPEARKILADFGYGLP
jgi:molybdate transport system substrate-binding protein